MPKRSRPQRLYFIIINSSRFGSTGRRLVHASRVADNVGLRPKLMGIVQSHYGFGGSHDARMECGERTAVLLSRPPSVDRCLAGAKQRAHAARSIEKGRGGARLSQGLPEVLRHRVSRHPHRLGREMGVARRGLDLRVAKELADHRQALT